MEEKNTSSSTKTSRKSNKMALIIMTGSIIMVITIGIGMSGYIIGYKQAKTITSQEYEEKAQKLSFPPGIANIQKREEIKSITGTITSIENTTISFTANKISDSVFESAEPQAYITHTNSDTEIVLIFTQLAIPDPENPFPKSESKNISLSDLQEGDVVTFFSETNLKEIGKQPEFNTSKIEQRAFPGINK